MTAALRVPKPITSYGFKPAPDDSTQAYCNDCRQQKPMATKSWRCAECAAAHKELDDSRLMPDPMYRGQSFSYTMGHIVGGDKSYRMRTVPLAEGERQLGWFVLPPFQRPAVWTGEQKAKFIESVWLGLPIGSYTYNQPSRQLRDGETSMWLIDGQQRITAIIEYVGDEYPVFGYRWSELPELDQRAFDSVVFPAFQIDETDPELLREIYDRLAYGGTPHEPKP